MATLTGAQPPATYAQPKAISGLIHRALPFVSGFGVVPYQGPLAQGVAPVRFWS